jgi:molecular chaperone DnaK (HSP70)
VSEDVARDVLEQARAQGRTMPEGTRDFVGRLLGEEPEIETAAKPSHPHFQRRAD